MYEHSGLKIKNYEMNVVQQAPEQNYQPWSWF